MQGQFVVYGAKGSGSVAVEACLTLMDLPYRVIEAAPWGDKTEQALLAKANPLGQVPVLELPDGERMTESAAILIWLTDAFPKAGLAPVPYAPERPAFLRGMSFISAAIYALYAVRDDPKRWVDGEAAQKQLVQTCQARMVACWKTLEGGIAPAPHILGSELSVLDVYAAVVSRWAPGRTANLGECPRLAGAVALVDSDPRLAALWAERFPSPPS